MGRSSKSGIVLKPDLSPNEVMTSELQELVKKAKGSVHTPKSIDYEESLPMTPVGKPDKKQSERVIGLKPIVVSVDLESAYKFQYLAMIKYLNRRSMLTKNTELYRGLSYHGVRSDPVRKYRKK